MSALYTYRGGNRAPRPNNVFCGNAEKCIIDYRAPLFADAPGGGGGGGFLTRVQLAGIVTVPYVPVNINSGRYSAEGASDPPVTGQIFPTGHN